MKKQLDAPNYTQIPNALLDNLMKDMGEAELRVVLAISRKTFGWHKDKDKISLTQLQDITGLSRQGVINGIDAGIERGIILKEPDGVSFIYSLIIEDADETSQRSRPEVVNEIDYHSQRSRLALVNVVDQTSQRSRHTKESIQNKIKENNTKERVNAKRKNLPRKNRLQELAVKSTLKKQPSNFEFDYEISETQSALETITGIPSSHANSQALKELEDMHCTREDIQAGYDWLKSQGKIIRYWGQLVGPARTAMAKRANPPAKSQEPADTIDYDALAKTLDINRKDRRPDYVPVAQKIDQEKLDAIPDNIMDTWESALNALEETIPRPQYDTWIRPAWAAGIGKDNMLVVGVYNMAGSEWLQKNAKEKLEEITGQRIRFEIRQQE